MSEGLERFQNLMHLTNHWARPIGPRSYYWYLTFESSAELQTLARRCQEVISFPYYDLVPLKGLHLTLDRIAFDGDITFDQLGALQATAARACYEVAPVDITIGSPRGYPWSDRLFRLSGAGDSKPSQHISYRNIVGISRSSS